MKSNSSKTAPADQVLILNDDVWGELIELTDGGAAPCFQCGVCAAICPWSEIRGEAFDVRTLIRRAQLGIENDYEDLWLCTTCGQCEAYCPRGVPVSDVMRGLRFLLWKKNQPPEGLPSVLWSIFWDNNPHAQPPSQRSRWSEDLDVELYDPESHEILLYVGCTSSYDRRAQKIARAFVSILKSAGIPFGILGDEEPCCGESALNLGHLPFFHELAEKAQGVFSERGVRQMVILSPHCYEVFKDYYPQSEPGFEPIHYTDYLAGLIQDNRLQLPASVRERVTFHDPCIMSRKEKSISAAREIIRAIPEVDFVEMPNNGIDTLCCGGGGGRMWMETDAKERFSDVRLEEATGTGAEIIATSCPFCVACLEDSVKASRNRRVRVMDLTELVSLSLR